VSILTNSTEKSPSWEANSRSADEVIIIFLRNPMIHHRDNKRPQLITILSQVNPVNSLTFKYCSPSIPRSPMWHFPFRIFRWKSIRTFHLKHVLVTTFLLHNTWRVVEIKNLLFAEFSPLYIRSENLNVMTVQIIFFCSAKCYTIPLTVPLA
jgi:hypothetical protein